MAISSETIGRLNRECQRIPLTEERTAELPVELGQLHAAVEAARPEHDFDRLPAAFEQGLHALKAADEDAGPDAAPDSDDAAARGDGTAAAGNADEIAAMSVCEAADAVASGNLSATDLVEAALARIDRLDTALHAFIRLDAEDALARAREIDETRGSGGAPSPLAGVPMAHKDMYYRAGRVSTCGARIRREFRPRQTATVLDRLDAAGAIDLGGLAMVEFAMGPHGFNAHLPRCRNVWDAERIPCGSSSGSGTAVAGRLVHAALGSDTGGSIRCPAAANGVVGINPTQGRVSRFGAMPMSWSLDVVGAAGADGAGLRPHSRRHRRRRRERRQHQPGAGAGLRGDAGAEPAWRAHRHPPGLFRRGPRPRRGCGGRGEPCGLHRPRCIAGAGRDAGATRYGVCDPSAGDEGRGRGQPPAVEARARRGLFGRGGQAPAGGLLHPGPSTTSTPCNTAPMRSGPSRTRCSGPAMRCSRRCCRCRRRRWRTPPTATGPPT